MGVNLFMNVFCIINNTMFNLLCIRKIIESSAVYNVVLCIYICTEIVICNDIKMAFKSKIQAYTKCFK